MTEEEAKTKWCPLVRFSDEGAELYSISNRGVALQRDVEPSTITRCIGSACMAWRFGGYRTDLTQDATTKRVVGFCGAFGSPQ